MASPKVLLALLAVLCLVDLRSCRTTQTSLVLSPRGSAVEASTMTPPGGFIKNLTLINTQELFDHADAVDRHIIYALLSSMFVIVAFTTVIVVYMYSHKIPFSKISQEYYNHPKKYDYLARDPNIMYDAMTYY